jgi:hypothetical protein
MPVPVGFVEVESGSETMFLQVLWFFLVTTIPTVVHYSSNANVT